MLLFLINMHHAATDEADLRTAKTLAVVEAAELAKTDNDEEAIFFLSKTGADAPKLVKVDSWTGTARHSDSKPTDTD